ncbi:MAG: hypothetical protein LQ344_000973 [Seirophora lacunosa]|nr:MAG: hypothetical protein LQ344_000973 [Seirophora lacunosa]
MTLKYPKLDIADPDSIQRFAKSVEAEHASVDVLINNAGVNLDMQYSPVNVKTTLDTNYRGTLNVSTFSGRFYKLEMTTNEANRCRVVNVSSTGSSLSGYSKEIQDRFRSPTMTLNDLEQMMTEYQLKGRRFRYDSASRTSLA